MSRFAPPNRLNLRAVASVRLRAALMLVCLCATAAARSDFAVQTPPTWVRAIAPASPADPNTAGGETGSRYLLFDRQVRVTANGAERYYHVAEQVTSPAGLERAAQIELTFEPTYERLVIHHIRIVRGGETINALRPDEINVIQQEDELDERLYNGTLSAVAFLSDVRVGDVVDYAYSVNGDNPVLAGRYADTFALAFNEPVAYLHTRLLWPAARTLHLRPRHTDAQAVVTQTGDETEYLWERRAVPAAEYEDATPSWYSQTPVVQLSEFGAWADVARWAAPLYRTSDKLAPPLAAQVERWRRELPDAEARLLAARRFVQDEVRYLGIELGPYSHTPTQPDKVFQRRFGDCKDKSLLLATMLGALGIEAQPALVNTDARRALDDWQPSPYAFDHVIVRAQLAGKTYWLDPTISYQRGTLANAYAPEYERALVLNTNADALTEIPLAPTLEPTTRVRELYRVKDFAAPVALNVTTAYHGQDADAMRFQLASQTRADLARDYLNYYAERNPSIEAAALPDIADDERANVITITERYSVPHFWKDSAHVFVADRLGEELAKPNVSRRTSPLRVSYPLNLEQLIEIELPHRQHVETGAEERANDALRFTAEATTVGQILRLRFTLRSLRDHVAAEDVAAHLALLDDARDLAGYELKQGTPVKSSAPFDRLLDALFAVCLLGVLLLVGYGWLKRRREARRRLHDSLAPTPATPGARPDTAIRLSDETEITNFLADVACPTCGGRGGAQGAAQGLVYNERRLVVVPLECEGCRRGRDFYFALAV
jgi:transglutaminase-like putative cysteine protease